MAKFKLHFTTAVKDYTENITTSDMKYSAAQVQELVYQQMAHYVIESPAPEEPSANSTQTTPDMSAMFEA